MMGADAIICGLSATGLAVARALARRGLQVCGIDPRPWEIGHRSRYVNSTTRLTLPSLRALAGSRQPLVFAAGDPELEWLLDHREELATFVRLPHAIADGSARGILRKRDFYERCLALKVDLPRTWLPTNRQEVEAAASAGRFPLLVKETMAPVRRCASARELERATPSPRTIVLQEMLPGPESALVVMAVHIGRDGKPGPIVTGRKLRQLPRDIGSASRVITEWQPELVETGLRLLDGLGYRGTCGLEWKQVGDRMMHIEINARPVQWFELAEIVTWDAWCERSGQPRPRWTQTDGVEWQYLSRDVVASRGRCKLAEVQALWAADDPLPGLLEPVYAGALALARGRGTRARLSRE